RRLVGNAVAAVDQHDPARAPRHQPPDIEFEPAVRQVDREQRVPGTVLALLADVEKRDLAAVAEPVPHGSDIDFGRLRHFVAPGMVLWRVPPRLLRRGVYPRIASGQTL